MKKFNIGNYKLPHMSPLPFKKIVKKVEKPFDKTPKRLDIQEPIPIRNNGVVNSAGGDEATDSIASVKAFNELKQSYMKRKFKGNDERLGPITPEQNLAEYNREKKEFYFNPSEGKLKLIPTDDAEMQDLTGIKSYQLAPKNK